MKKQPSNKSKIRTVTLAESRAWRTTKLGKQASARIASLSDDKIDTSDIPELSTLQDGIPNPFYRPVTQPVTIRLNAPDIAMARKLSKTKGLPYQTYIKMLLHEALSREASRT